MALIDDGLGGSRVVAWTLASSLAGQPSAQQALTIAAQDALVAGVIASLFTPPRPLPAGAQLDERGGGPRAAPTGAADPRAGRAGGGVDRIPFPPAGAARGRRADRRAAGES